jgi:hypothetical protein
MRTGTKSIATSRIPPLAPVTYINRLMSSHRSRESYWFAPATSPDRHTQAGGSLRKIGVEVHAVAVCQACQSPYHSPHHGGPTGAMKGGFFRASG